MAEHLTRQELFDKQNGLLPETDFIAVFGTSHTHGSCHDLSTNKKDLPEDLTWGSQLGQLMNMPVMNYGVPGTSNLAMLQQVHDFLLLPRSKNCRQIIFENRIAEWTTRLPGEFHADFSSFVPDVFYPELMAGRSVTGKSVREKNRTLSRKFNARIVINSTLDEFLENCTKTAYAIGLFEPGQEIPPYFKEMMVKQRETFINFYGSFSIHYLDDFYLIRSMIDACRLAGIPAKWFCWDNHLGGRMNERNYDILVDIFESTCDLFDHQIKEFKYGSLDTYMKEFKESPPRCDCGHQKPEYHNWVANKIYHEMRKQ